LGDRRPFPYVRREHASRARVASARLRVSRLRLAYDPALVESALRRRARGSTVCMNREERRHPGKHENTKAPQERELDAPEKPQEDASVRAKGSRHKKVTADKWNQ
jgi:hypothetical protein